jgi:hypothetical protein
VKTLLSSVTDPFRASARPSTAVSVVTVTEVSAMIVPTNSEPVPSVAEAPTCQKTLQANAPFVSATLLSVAVVRLEPI